MTNFKNYDTIDNDARFFIKDIYSFVGAEFDKTEDEKIPYSYKDTISYSMRVAIKTRGDDSKVFIFSEEDKGILTTVKRDARGMNVVGEGEGMLSDRTSYRDTYIYASSLDPETKEKIYKNKIARMLHESTFHGNHNNPEYDPTVTFLQLKEFALIIREIQLREEQKAKKKKNRIDLNESVKEGSKGLFSS